MTAEIRSWLEDIQTATNKLIDLKCIDKGSYSFTDYIYNSKNSHCDFNKEFLRIRVYENTNWNQKPVQLVQKIKQEIHSERKVTLREEFDQLADAQTFLECTHDFIFSASREGREYSINHLRIFVEDIEYLGPSIEVLAPTKKEVMDILDLLNVKDMTENSVPQLIYNILFTENESYTN